MFGSSNKQASATRNSVRNHEASKPRWAWLRAHRQAVLLSSMALGVLLLLWFAALSVLDRPIARAEISGNFTQVSRVQIEQALEPFARAGFVSVDLVAVKRALEAIQWIDHVRVERSWPDGLRVAITEQTAVARWRVVDQAGAAQQVGLLNTRGELFLPDARDLPADLPELSGPEGTETQVANLYLETYPRLLTVGLRLQNVVLDARGAWNLQLSNSVEVRLGRQDVQARLERFISAASPVIATRLGDVAYVDMRYSNGFAIGWGDGKASTQSSVSNGNV